MSWNMIFLMKGLMTILLKKGEIIAHLRQSGEGLDRGRNRQNHRFLLNLRLDA
jgi:hypothetical protein